MRQLTALVALVTLTACGGVTGTGSGADPSSEGGGSNVDGSGGQVPGHSDGGRSSTTGGQPPVGYGGRAGDGGGCPDDTSWPGTGGASSTGGAQPVIAPTCPVDAQGFATTSMDELCSLYRCPSRAADLLGGLVCDQPAGPGDGIVLTTGCGFQTVRFSGAGVEYQATFPADPTGPVSLRVSQSWPFGSCAAIGYVAGEAPEACATETSQRCHPAAEPVGPYAGCREPGQVGCAECALPWTCGGGCDVMSAFSSTGRYETGAGLQSECRCAAHPACARCTTEIEHQIRTMPEKPQCDCPPVPAGAGGAPPVDCSGLGGSSSGGRGPIPECVSHCDQRNTLAAVCPGIVE